MATVFEASYDELKQLEAENSAYRARLATAENEIGHLKTLLKASRKHVNEVIQYKLAAAIDAALKE